MNKIIMIMHIFKWFFYCLTVYTSKKIHKITQNAAYFAKSKPGAFSQIAGKGPGLSCESESTADYIWHVGKFFMNFCRRHIFFKIKYLKKKQCSI